MKSIEIKGSLRTETGKKAAHSLRTMVFLAYCTECRKTKTETKSQLTSL